MRMQQLPDFWRLSAALRAEILAISDPLEQIEMLEGLIAEPNVASARLVKTTEGDEHGNTDVGISTGQELEEYRQLAGHSVRRSDTQGR